MFPDIAAPKMPIAIRTEHIVDENTTFRVQQHGKGLSSAKFTIFGPCRDVATDKSLHATNAAFAESQRQCRTSSSSSTSTPSKQSQQPLMSVDGKYASMDGRRSFFDASGLPLFDLYHRPVAVTWYVELPGRKEKNKDESSATPIARIMPRFSIFKDNLEVSVRNAADHGEEVTLRVQGQDIWKQRTNVYLGEKVVMTAKRTDKMSTYLPGKKLEWIVDIAAGMDMSLASVIVVVLAANMYDSAGQASRSSS